MHFGHTTDTKNSNERNGHVKWDTIEYAGQFTKGIAHDVWKKFRKYNLGDATLMATRDTHREKNSEMSYWRTQGRFLTTAMVRPTPLTGAEPDELTTFCKELRDRFRQSISEQITVIQNFKPLSAAESVSSLYNRFK